MAFNNIWTGPMGIIPRPCGHPYLTACGCYYGSGGWVSTDTKVVVHNGLCQCRGPLSLHPFHSEPLAAEYVGRHRKDA
jgi:hypothetical protein